MERTFHCKECNVSADEKINKYMISWGATYFVCEQCNPKKFYVSLHGSRGPGKTYTSCHPKKSM